MISLLNAFTGQTCGRRQRLPPENILLLVAGTRRLRRHLLTRLMAVAMGRSVINISWCTERWIDSRRYYSQWPSG